jgi:hypothetical protein
VLRCLLCARGVDRQSSHPPHTHDLVLDLLHEHPSLSDSVQPVTLQLLQLAFQVLHALDLLRLAHVQTRQVRNEGLHLLLLDDNVARKLLDVVVELLGRDFGGVRRLRGGLGELRRGCRGLRVLRGRLGLDLGEGVDALLARGHGGRGVELDVCHLALHHVEELRVSVSKQGDTAAGRARTKSSSSWICVSMSLMAACCGCGDVDWQQRVGACKTLAGVEGRAGEA